MDLERALREVAVLVARGVAPGEVFAAISEQAARVCGVGAGAVVRFGRTGAEILGRWGERPPATPVPFGGGAISLVRNTGLPARFDVIGPAAPGEGADAAPGEGAAGPAGVAGTAPGEGAARPPALSASAAAPVTVEGEVWGALVVTAFGSETLPRDTEDALTAFAELAALAIAGADARERLLESRARLVRTADEERRRLERNLHDGAQQRLVSARLALRMLRNRVDEPELDRVAGELATALEELRELARGLHPAALARGLTAAIGALAARSPVPVTYDVDERRFPEEIETAAYYVTAEALTNAAKHAHASHINVTVTGDERTLRLTIRDDGRGGAVQGEGSGLIGLQDRVEALRGRLSIKSPPGAGTTLRAEFPLP